MYYRSDPGARRVGDALDGAIGVGSGGDWLIEEIELDRRGARFTLTAKEKALPISLQVTGRHNVANAAVIAVLAHEIGVDDESIVRGLSKFQGAPRRFEFRGSHNEVDIYEDYAHLPGEITATLDAARDAGYERIGVVFQPHRVTRTMALAGELATALGSAEWVIVTDIYDAGEENKGGVTGELVATPLKVINEESLYKPALASIWDSLLDRPRVDAIFFLGAGDIAQVIPELRPR